MCRLQVWDDMVVSVTDLSKRPRKTGRLGRDLTDLIRGWWMFEVSECDEEDAVDDEWRMMTHV